MSDRCHLQLTVGGTLPRASVESFKKEFLDMTWGDDRAELSDFYDDDRLYYEEDEMNYSVSSDFTEICKKLGLSFTAKYGSCGGDPPLTEYWAPSMEEVGIIAFTEDGEGFVLSGDLRDIVDAYCVSAAERMRAVCELMPPDIPELPVFIVED